MPIVQRILTDCLESTDTNDVLAHFGTSLQETSLQTISEIMRGSHLQMSAMYWAATAHFLVHGEEKELPMRESIWSFLQACFTSGGFSPFPGDDAHILSTYSAIQICFLYNFDINDINNGARQSIIDYIKSLQTPDGSFMGDIWGEIDTRFSYCAIASLSLLGEDALSVLDLEGAAQFIKNCSNFDGGYGATPGCESHAGQIFCCVATLQILDKLDEYVDIPRLGAWLSQRQNDLDGGLNGRPEKLQDVCYSWWVLSSLEMIHRKHWIDIQVLINFILSCQDNVRGGFADRPGNVTDLFHTLFAITGLSLLGYKCSKQLESIDPIYCLPKKVLKIKD